MLELRAKPGISGTDVWEKSGTLMIDGTNARQTATFAAAPDGEVAAPCPWYGLE